MRAVSPFRKRWHLTPPVARPLVGYSARGVTLAPPVVCPNNESGAPAIVTTRSVAGSTPPKNSTFASFDSFTPATPPPRRPCGRTRSAEKCSSCASEVMNARFGEVSSTAPTTSSPSSRRITSHESFPITSGLTRLTTPRSVPRARPGPPGSREVRPTTRSPCSRGHSSRDSEPPCRFGAVAVNGTVGSSMALARSRRPVLVITPNSAREVTLIAATITSCAALGPVMGRGAAESVRAARPVVDNSTQHGSSGTSRGAADLTTPSAASNTVLRGVPNRSAISSSSEATKAFRTVSSSRIRCNSSMRAASSSASAFSSSVEYFVRRRSCMSRMWFACTSSRSKAPINRVRASAASSLERTMAMTSSMSTMASSSPLTRCNRSRALPRRCRVRRIVTWSR